MKKSRVKEKLKNLACAVLNCEASASVDLEDYEHIDFCYRALLNKIDSTVEEILEIMNEKDRASQTD